MINLYVKVKYTPRWPISQGFCIGMPGVHSSVGRWRNFFILPCCSLSRRRRAAAARVGWVGRRLGGGGPSKEASKAANFSRQSFLFRSWVRYLSERMESTPSLLKRAPSASSSRRHCPSSRTELFRGMKRNSALVFDLLTFCPPGPELRSKEKRNSESGILKRELISITSMGHSRRKFTCLF